MKKNIIFIFLIFSLVLLFFEFVKFKNEPPTEEAPHVVHKQSFFFPAEVKIATADLPSLSLQLENQTIDTLLDLGFNGECSIDSAVLQSIQSKELFGTREMFDFRGNCCQENLYSTERITIGKLTFKNIVLNERPVDFHKNTSIVQEGREPSKDLPASIGWELFNKFGMVLLLDFKNRKIGFSDSPETLSKEGYPIHAFTQVPLLLDRDLVEFETHDCGKLIRVTLDTGTSCNVINTEPESSQSLENYVFDPTNITTISHFMIGERDFGDIAFRHIPIKTPVEIDIFLGMEFFLEHAVVIDFGRGWIYFLSKNIEDMNNQ